MEQRCGRTDHHLEPKWHQPLENCDESSGDQRPVDDRRTGSRGHVNRARREDSQHVLAEGVARRRTPRADSCGEFGGRSAGNAYIASWHRGPRERLLSGSANDRNGRELPFVNVPFGHKRPCRDGALGTKPRIALDGEIFLQYLAHIRFVIDEHGCPLAIGHPDVRISATNCCRLAILSIGPMVRQPLSTAGSTRNGNQHVPLAETNETKKTSR
jgi:hypothetical protein